MREFINAVSLTEAKHLGGIFYTSVTPRDLVRMASIEDLRGSAVDDKVYVWNANEQIHRSARKSLGLPYDGNEDNYGFDFYCWNLDTDGEDDRTEWVSELKSPQFEIDNIGVSDSSLENPLENRGFAFMVGRSK